MKKKIILLMVLTLAAASGCSLEGPGEMKLAPFTPFTVNADDLALIQSAGNNRTNMVIGTDLDTARGTFVFEISSTFGRYGCLSMNSRVVSNKVYVSVVTVDRTAGNAGEQMWVVYPELGTGKRVELEGYSPQEFYYLPINGRVLVTHNDSRAEGHSGGNNPVSVIDPVSDTLLETGYCNYIMKYVTEGPDGSIYAVTGCCSGDDKLTKITLDPFSMEFIADIEIQGHVESSMTGCRISCPFTNEVWVSDYNLGRIRIFDTAAKTELTNLALPGNPAVCQMNGNLYYYSPRDFMIAAYNNCSENSGLAVFDADSRNLVTNLPGLSDVYQVLNGKLYVYYYRLTDERIEVYNLEDNFRLIKTIDL